MSINLGKSRDYKFPTQTEADRIRYELGIFQCPNFLGPVTSELNPIYFDVYGEMAFIKNQNSISTINLNASTNAGKIDLTSVRNISTISCSYSQILEINAEYCDSLENLDVSHSPIEKISLTGCENLKTLDATYCLYLTELDLSGLTNLSSLIIIESAITNLNISGCFNLKQVSMNSSQISEINLSGLNKLTEIYCNGSFGLTTLKAKNCNSLTQINASSSALVSLVEISGSESLVSLNLIGCAIPQANIDEILVALSENGKTVGTCYLSGGTNAAPSATGEAAITDLTTGAKSWTISTN